MVRVVAVVIILLLLGSQFPVICQVRIGLHGGTNISSLTQPGDWEWRPKITGGISADIELLGQFMLVGQINYTQKWTALDHSPWGQMTYGIFHITLMHEYIEMPIYIRWRPGNSVVRWFCECGPAFDYLISAKAEWWHSVAGTLSVEQWDKFRKTDVAIVAGSGLEYHLANSTVLTMSLHYAYGLTKIFDPDTGSQTIGIQADVGVMYVL